MDRNNPLTQMAQLAQIPDHQLELARSALMISTLEYPLLDVAYQISLLDSLAAAASKRFRFPSEPAEELNTLSAFLFDEIGFSGDTENYYNPRNSHLSEVLKRRLGIPITLSLIYIEVAARLSIPLEGISMPGHFIVRHKKARDLIVDPFERGIILSKEEAIDRFKAATHESAIWQDDYLATVSNKDFITRILGNLKGAHLRIREYGTAVKVSDLLVALRPDLPQERRDRGIIHYRMGNYNNALSDLRGFLNKAPSSPDNLAVTELVEHLAKLINH